MVTNPANENFVLLVWWQFHSGINTDEMSEVIGGVQFQPERVEGNLISCSTFQSKMHYNNKLKAASRISSKRKHGSD